MLIWVMMRTKLVERKRKRKRTRSIWRVSIPWSGRERQMWIFFAVRMPCKSKPLPRRDEEEGGARVGPLPPGPNLAWVPPTFRLKP